jgi:hypothetical protein
MKLVSTSLLVILVTIISEIFTIPSSQALADCPFVSTTSSVPAGTVACYVTQGGLGATQYPATSITAGTANTVKSTSATLYEIIISWSVPSTTGECYVTLYNSASPTVGASFVEIIPINVATPGIIAVAPPPTIGGAYTTALSYAITTTPTGTTACNTTASSLFFEAWYK